jgi:hypothetical protein
MLREVPMPMLSWPFSVPRGGAGQVLREVAMP